MRIDADMERTNRAEDEIDRLREQRDELLTALKLVWSMFEDQRIVRNITNDHNPDWALRMLNFTRELQTIRSAILRAEGCNDNL